MNTPGVDPYKYLDEVEYLFEVIPPELQDLAEPVIQALCKKLLESS